MKVGDIVLAEVIGIAKYGFFVQVDDYKGLCHISQISNDYVYDINNYVSLGEYIYVLILTIDEVKKQLDISIKDICYVDKEDKIKETRKGFLPLKEMLPVWIDEKIGEYEKE